MRYDYSIQGIRDSVRRSLDILGVSKVDLLFLHEPHLIPITERSRVVDTLRQIQTDGLTVRLGIAGGHGEDWNDLVESGAFDVAMLFRRIDPCVLNGIVEDIPRLRQAGILTYGASPLHMGLLGSRHEEFISERPEWVWESQIDRAIELKILADKNGLTLPQLAHRFTFSVAELDRVVIGANNQSELQSALDDFAAGPLPPTLFQEIVSLNTPA
jgi:L-galactose dehydrogenase